jgi:hypothetical protein
LRLSFIRVLCAVSKVCASRQVIGCSFATVFRLMRIIGGNNARMRHVYNKRVLIIDWQVIW